MLEFKPKPGETDDAFVARLEAINPESLPKHERFVLTIELQWARHLLRKRNHDGLRGVG
jgi:hypothetical protein